MRRTVVVAFACLLAAACGGTSGSPSASSGRRAAPTIPHTVALQLASQADRVAADLRAGDGCRARDDATLLQQATSHAIAGGDVPASLATPLTSSVATLAQRIVCRPPKPKPKPHEHHHHDHHHKPGDGNGQGNGGD
jgi:hypothetical protein